MLDAVALRGNTHALRALEGRADVAKLTEARAGLIGMAEALHRMVDVAPLRRPAEGVRRPCVG